MKPESPSINRFWTLLDQTIQNHQMLAKGDRVLVAVSGGPDSTALCLGLNRMKGKWGLNLGVAHVNHQLRGLDAEDDENFVQKLARKYDLPFYSEKSDVRTLAADRRLSIEEAGRMARYAFFGKLAREHNYQKVATGHTKDDNAEQVLINLLRGSGTKGLSGIPPVRDNRYIRPLIRHSKTQILSFLKRENQNFCTDKSNIDRTFLRNKIRIDLIPLLEKEYNPQVVDSLDRLTRIAAHEDAYLELSADDAFEKCRIKSEDRSVELQISVLVDLHPALLSRVLRRAILAVKADLRRISLQHLTDIAYLCTKDVSNKILDLPGRIRIYKSGTVLTVKKEDLPLRELGAKEKKNRLKKARQASAKAVKDFTKR